MGADVGKPVEAPEGCSAPGRQVAGCGRQDGELAAVRDNRAAAFFFPSELGTVPRGGHGPAPVGSLKLMSPIFIGKAPDMS